MGCGGGWRSADRAGRVGVAVRRAIRCLKPDSQASHILAHLVSGRTITPLGALKKWGCLRLGARIHQLRGRGHDIKGEPIEVAGKRVSIYWISRKCV